MGETFDASLTIPQQLHSHLSFIHHDNFLCLCLLDLRILTVSVTLVLLAIIDLAARPPAGPLPLWHSQAADPSSHYPLRL